MARLLLARLVVGPGVVSVDELADVVWGESVPATLAGTLKSHVSRLRSRLRHAVGYDPIASYPGGYRLVVSPSEIDAGRFESSVTTARSLPSREAADVLRQALSLWRGPAFGDLRYEGFAAGEAARLEELRLVALEACLDADLRTGLRPDTLAELASLVRQHPLRERLAWLNMQALHLEGRQRDALLEYDRYRSALIEESGLEPEAELTALRNTILGGQPSPSPIVNRPAIHYARTASGVHIGYVRRGSAPPWLIAPGCDAHISVVHLDEDPLAAEVEDELASPGGLIRLDRPGIGLSEPIEVGRAPTSAEWAEATLAVADHAGLDRFTVFGTGWSTPAALSLAAARPDRVEAVIVFNGFARFVRSPDYSIGIPPELVERFRDSVLDTSLDVMPSDLDDVMLHAPSRVNDAQFRSWWRRAGQQSATPAVSRAHFALLFEADVCVLLSQISQPTLVLHRRANRYVRTAHGRYIAEHIGGATYQEFDGADQLLPSGDPYPVLDAIRSFVRSKVG